MGLKTPVRRDRLSVEEEVSAIGEHHPPVLGGCLTPPGGRVGQASEPSPTRFAEAEPGSPPLGTPGLEDTLCFLPPLQDPSNSRLAVWLSCVFPEKENLFKKPLH